MTFFHRPGSLRASSILLPLIVGLTLVFSKLSLLERGAHAQAEQPAAPAAAGPATEADWIRGIGTVASAIAGPGFAVWYAYHMTTKRIPEVEKAYKETIDRMQADHTAEVKGLITDFRADIKSMWETKRQDDAELRSVLKQLNSRATDPRL